MIGSILGSPSVPEISLSVSPARNQIDANPDANQSKSWKRPGEQSTAVLFLAAATVAMAGWLYLLAQGLWAVASWLIF